MYLYKKFLFILICFTFLFAEKYNISLWSIPVAQVEMINNPGEVLFKTKSIGLVNYIWPHKNSYSTFYNTDNFGLRKYTKNIKQGDFTQELTWKYNIGDSTLVLGDIKTAITDSIQTIFTLLARVSLESYEYLDTKWFPVDHESCTYKGRFLWSDTVSVLALNKQILCDHFRLDLIKLEQEKCGVEESDYFMENIIYHNSIRQIWVEKNNNKRIIKASAMVYGFPLEAIIINE
jgi:hypothetical protein